MPSSTNGFTEMRDSSAGDGQAAHTTPVCVSVDGGGFHNGRTTKHYLLLAENYLKELEEEISRRNDHPNFQSWRYIKGLEQRIAEVRLVMERLSALDSGKK